MGAGLIPSLLGILVPTTIQPGGKDVTPFRASSGCRRHAWSRACGRHRGRACRQDAERQRQGRVHGFEPSFVEAAPGGTIKFVATDQFHNAETLPEIWPEGAATFKGELSKDVTLTVEKEGVYGIKCSPHYIMGHGGARVGRQAGQCRSGQGLSAARDGGQALGGARGEGPAISRPKPPVVMPANAGIQ